MGIVLVLLGLAAAGVVADYVVENGLAAAPDQTFQLFGASFTRTGTEVALATAVLGALAILFLFVGIGLLRGSWGRRRGLRRRVRDLERENAELRSKAHLNEIVRIESVEEEQPPAPASEDPTPASEDEGEPKPMTRR
ncbi:MAG TPA: hypothetical protein VF984_02530 [Actinomycetota bacterium]